MKQFIVLLLGLLLTGCSVPAAQWETVGDFNTTELSKPVYGITVGLPEKLLTDETDSLSRYELQELWVEVGTFYAKDAGSAIEKLSGFDKDRLTILQTTRFDLPEYQFAWYSQTEEGGRLYRADMVMDGMTCYAVVCSAPEKAGEEPWAEARQVLSTFGLLPIELV